MQAQVPAAPLPPAPFRVEPSEPAPAGAGFRALAWTLAGVAVLSTLLTAALDVVTSPGARAAAEASPGWIIGLPGVPLTLLGALLLSRVPRNPVSWVVALTGLHWALDGLAQSWLTVAVTGDRLLPGATLAFWLVQRFGAWLLLGLPLLLLLYPDGRLPRGRWRTASLVSLAATSLLPLLLLVIPSAIADARAGEPLPAVYRRPGLDLDPTSLDLPATVFLPLMQVAFPLALLGIAVPVASVVARYRRATGDDRSRMRWLLWAAVVDALVMLAAILVPGDTSSLALSVAVGLTGAAVTIGILRPRLVDIDRLLGSTLVHGGLTVTIVLLDLAVLWLAGTLIGGRLAQREATLLTLLVAACYLPLRAPLTGVVRRWVLGDQQDPYRVVAGLAERLEHSGGPDEQLLAVAATVAEAFRSPYVGVQVDQPSGEQLVAEHGRRPAQVQSLPVSYRGDHIGHLLLPAGGPRARLLPRDERLLADVVRQAAAAARASSLAAQVQASREALVAAREEERRRLRRDLHDGLGPSLGAVVLRIDTARNLAASRPEESDRLLRAARDDVAAALADVRRLVHDLRPPALDDVGLTAAVGQQADRLLAPRIAVTVDADAGVDDDLPAAVEVAAYRIASEALANVARHSGATTCSVRLSRRPDGALEVLVSDDGAGIRPGAPAGVGLVSLRERAAELGGGCTVECPPEGGTVVRALLPASEGGTRG